MKYILLFFLLFLMSCNTNIFTKKNKSSKNTCVVCDSLIKKEFTFLTKKYVTKDVTYILEFLSPNFEIVRDTGVFERISPFEKGYYNIYSFDQYFFIQKNKFCFIGKNKKDILNFFNIPKNVDIINSLFLTILVGEKIKNNDGNIEMYKIKQGRILQFENFSNSSVFLGTHSDSINLQNCKKI